MLYYFLGIGVRRKVDYELAALLRCGVQETSLFWVPFCGGLIGCILITISEDLYMLYPKVTPYPIINAVYGNKGLM